MVWVGDARRTCLQAAHTAEVYDRALLYVATVDQICPLEGIIIGQAIDVPFADLQRLIIHNEQGSTASAIVCVQPQLIQSNVMDHTHLQTTRVEAAVENANGHGSTLAQQTL